MSQLLLTPTPPPKYIDHLQRRYRWVGPRGRRWYYLALRAIAARHNFNLLW